MVKGILCALGLIVLLSVSCRGTLPANTNLIRGEAFEVKTRIEFVFLADDVKTYPDLFETFVLAVQEWAEVVPIEVMVMVPDEDGPVTETDIKRTRHGVILVNFTNNIPSDFGDDDNKLGIWYPTPRILNLDLDDMYKDNVFRKDMARAVSLHEIGHVLGLPHIGNKNSTDILDGDLVIESGAENMLMHPFIPTDYENVKISNLEIAFVRRYLLL